MKKLVIGILAHVDAGKTTLSEAMLYTTGSIRTLGRVDHQDAFLDHFALERERGITIFSKQALLQLPDTSLTLLDTPGHVDFSAEMERTLQVLDYAILVISGSDGVQGHTATLWKLLERYQIPVFLFVNKMDQPGNDRSSILAQLKARLNDNCTDFEEPELNEALSLCDETLLEEFLETGNIEVSDVQKLIRERKVFPVFFGSALKLTGINEFLQAIDTYIAAGMDRPVIQDDFGARVFKITRDEQGNRLTHMKVTGGLLKVRDVLLDEKINQVRIYSGTRYEAVAEVNAGTVCAVTGLTKTFPGQGLGTEKEALLPVLEPVLTYRLILPEDCAIASLLPRLRELEEEEPELHIVWNEELQEIQIQLMGEVQIDVIRTLIQERFGVEVSFGEGNIIYKETIRDMVEGVGHYEPLRHYAEVHILMEPLEAGSGLQFASTVREEDLERNWQRLILTHLEEKEHKGVLTGSAITDMKITLVAGRAHQKHTEGGDFRQATYRAVRQGLMQAESVLLEPYYDVRLEIPASQVGRAMNDLEARFGSFQTPEIEGEAAVLIGRAPVSTMRGYQQEVAAYTKGHGRCICTLRDYEPCHNAEEVLADRDYDPDENLNNPSGSVFCAHGAGFYVPWFEVPEYMHLESVLQSMQQSMRKMADRVATTEAGFDEDGVGTREEWNRIQQARQKDAERRGLLTDSVSIGTEEVDAILARAHHANRKEDGAPRNQFKRVVRAQGSSSQDYDHYTYKPQQAEKEYLLVDGYNIIFAWDELKELAATNIDGARGRLTDILCNYQGIRQCELILVFDAYRVQGHETEAIPYHNILVVYTKEAETADQYIEKFAHENGRKYRVTVATSDGLEQIIIRGQGCELLSAREFEREVKEAVQRMREEYDQKQLAGQTQTRNRLGDQKDITSIYEEFLNS